MRKRSGIKRTVINTTKIVRDPPIVIVHKGVVDDPPIVIVRRHIDEEEGPRVRGRREAAIEPPPTDRRQRGDIGRVIKAEAEVTILGPDRMTIRLFRKRHGGAAAARAD